MAALDSDAVPLRSILQRRGLRQFVKFCIVGASSTLINWAIYLLLIEAAHLDQWVGSLVVARPVAQLAAFLAAVTNGFFWNNRWTFRTGDADGKGRRYLWFVATNVVGLCLNLAILNGVAGWVTPETAALVTRYLPLKDPAGFIGLVVATFVVVIWNFTASKYWTFRR